MKRSTFPQFVRHPVIIHQLNLEHLALSTVSLALTSGGNGSFFKLYRGIIPTVSFEKGAIHLGIKWLSISQRIRSCEDDDIPINLLYVFILIAYIHQYLSLHF